MKSNLIKPSGIILICIFCSFFSYAQLNYVKSYAKKKYFNGGWSLFGAMTLNNQSINDANITSPVTYLYNSVNNDVFKTGFTGGLRWDGIYNQKHLLSLMIAVNRVNLGTHYLQKYRLPPYMDDFTHFKADNQFTTISMALHYKALLPVNEMRKYKFYAIIGPSVDYNISNISNEYLINRFGNRAFINGDLGAEFDNNGYYILYGHYKLGTNLLNSTVPIQLNRFELGMSVKLTDLF
jgi:hypothetical protein